MPDSKRRPYDCAPIRRQPYKTRRGGGVENEKSDSATEAEC